LQEAEAFAKEEGLLFFEVSAASGKNVMPLFREIGVMWHVLELMSGAAERVPRTGFDEVAPVGVPIIQKSEKKGGCCN